MRLLRLGADEQLTLTEDLISKIPPYAILSHTWGEGHDYEVTFQDLEASRGKEKLGYQKVLFCGQQAKRDDLEYFWVDTCCIDKTSSAELTEAINSMFSWYQNAQKCYVYLTDVSCSGNAIDEPARSTWEIHLRNSRWFTRGWTLQELIAPRTVQFFSSEGQRLGDKQSLEQIIHDITQIPVHALRGGPLSGFGAEERISWSRNRSTLRQEDRAYALLGILGVSLPLVYGEGEHRAFERLRAEFSTNSTQVRVLAKLLIAEGATFDSYAEEQNPLCLTNTRIELLHEIMEWAKDPTAKSVYWLNGMAGTGKSTISRTLADKFSENGTLGASFFFRRGEGDRGGSAKLFTTIASQLVKRLPEVATRVQSAIDVDPAIFSKALREQFERLILRPLSETSETSFGEHTLVIVLDALDECEREEDIRLLIRLLSSAKTPEHIRLKFFLTSRPELPIRLGFKAIDGKYKDFVLHEVVETVIERDISLFLQHELHRVRNEYNGNVTVERQLPANWPNHTDVQVLVDMATPLFIFAATMCRFIADRRGGNPDKKLQKVLGYRAMQGSKLSATYMPVLEQLIAGLHPTERTEIVQQFREIVGSIVVLADPLTAFALAQLLDIELEDILAILDSLHSTLNIPESSKQPIKLLHLSFRDFLVDPERQKDPFWVNEKEAHRRLATCCLHTMQKSLRANIFAVTAPGTPQSSFKPDEINEKLALEVRYACRFWSHHLKAADASISDGDEICRFLSTHFLHWLEALSWLGRASESIEVIKTVQSLLQLDNCQRISEYLSDAFRFILATNSIIQTAPLQIYSSALIFTPRLSIIRSTYEKDIADWILLKPIVPSTWGQTIQTLEGHKNLVTSVGFSPGGRTVVSASHDKTVRLWAADTGALLQTLKGHSSCVYSVGFSPDGRTVVSASDDKTVRLWAADTGALLQTLKGHSDSVLSAAFSPDGRTVASASHDETVRLWAADTGALLQTFKGHSNWVYSVAFSPDGKIVASSSQDETVRLWAADTGALLQTLKGHSSSVTSVAFSPDGRTVATASHDNTVRLWAADTGALLQTLEVHSDSVLSVGFSPDGRTVASGSRDKTVGLWAADTGALLQTLEGHSNWVYSVAFSPDGRTVASASHDKTIRLWPADTGAGALLETLGGHSDWVISVRFSPNGRTVASASRDKTVRLWAAETGALLQTFEGHNSWVYSVAFSPDGRTVASGSGDKTVRLWATDTGVLLKTLEGHSDWITSIAFSPDGRTVASASASGDKLVRLWAVDTGALLQMLEGHSEWVTSVAFSPDGRTVASASGDKTVRLWAADTGALLQTIEVGTISYTLSFDTKGNTITADNRVFVLQTKPDSPTALNDSHIHTLPTTEHNEDPPNNMGKVGFGISRHENWIKCYKERILWLPADCRLSCSAILGSTVVVGCMSGRVLVLRFKDPFSWLKAVPSP